MIHDDLARHLPAARSFDRAAVPLGMYVGWCANLQLLSASLERAAGGLVMRVRYREITGAELLVGGCGGVLSDEHLNDEGRSFTAAYLPRYLDAFRATFGGDPYDVKDAWAHYDLIAPVLTRELMAFRGRGAAGGTRGAKVLGSGDRRWWQRKR